MKVIVRKLKGSLRKKNSLSYLCAVFSKPLLHEFKVAQKMHMYVCNESFAQGKDWKED